MVLHLARRQLWLAAGFGLAGSLTLSAAASGLLDGRPVSWWLVVHLGGASLAHDLFWAGVAALCAAWLWLGWLLRAERGQSAQGDRLLTPGRLAAVAALWALPLIAGPALFSHDLYSYLAQGELMRSGLDPYSRAPVALASVHQQAVLHTVSPFWRHTTAPYGPAFVGLSALIAVLAGSHIVLAVILLRGLEVAGVALMAAFVPRLAGSLGADPALASWLAVASPLTLLELIGAGHNDALMAGLLAAGVYLAVRRHPLAAIGLCTLAATVKLPAAAAVVMIAICWLRDDPGRSPAILGRALAVCAAVLAAVGVATGAGLGWLNGSLLSTPGKVHLAITPATALGWSAHSLLETLGLNTGGSARAWELAVGHVFEGLTALLGLWLCWRVRYPRLVASLAALLLVSVLGGPAAWPWYLCWGIVLAAGLPGWQRSGWLVAVSVLGVFAVYPGGTLRFPVSDSPYLLAAYAAALVLAALLHRRGPAPPRPAEGGLAPRPAEGALSVPAPLRTVEGGALIAGDAEAVR
jgi:alpha-1,6-mannosyltransferase